ncbi:MAG: alpha/beta fold hydrolase [Planctomycetota bacterium]
MQARVNGVMLHYELVGDGEPILFVHGFPLSGVLWKPIAGRLDGWRCVIPDLRGHGQSEATPATTIEQFSDDLVALLDKIGEQRPVVLCGLSMGGAIAFDFFRRHRARLQALVLVDCRANADTPEGRQQREELAQAVLRDGSGVAADSMIDKLLAPQAPPALRTEWHAIMAATPPVGVAAAARALAQRFDSTVTLGRIDVPTLLVFGEEDRITPPDLARQMFATIPGARLELIPGAGHLPPVEQPERFLRAIRTFLADLARGR